MSDVDHDRLRRPRRRSNKYIPPVDAAGDARF